jgi:signal transduction histidine kinase
VTAGLNEKTVPPSAAESGSGLELGDPAELMRLGTLAYTIAHDLNNLLTPILSLSELVRIGLAQDDASAPLLVMIEQAALQAKALVQRILMFRYGSRETFKPLDLSQTLAALVPILEAGMPQAITLRHRIMVTPPVLADADEIRRAVLNLISNAVQAIGERPGIVSLELSIATDSEKRDVARLVVADTGHGMDEATQRRIFEPFFTTKGPGQGTGIGLSILRAIVAAHDGSIRVTSEPGKGARFEIDLPLLQSQPRQGTA